MERKGDGNYVKACTRSMVVGTALVGRPRKTWQNKHASAKCTVCVSDIAYILIPSSDSTEPPMSTL